MSGMSRKPSVSPYIDGMDRGISAQDRAVDSVVDHEFPPVAESARAARLLVTAALAAEAVHRPDLLELFVSEIVTNAIIHAGTPFRVTVTLRPGIVRVAILDRNPAIPVVRAPDAGAVAGRGLRMISDHCVAWGIEPGHRGKTVWFELAVNGCE